MEQSGVLCYILYRERSEDMKVPERWFAALQDLLWQDPEEEVKLKLKEYQDALISGVQLDTILYFEDWADTWFEGHKDNIAPTTQESYKYCLKMYSANLWKKRAMSACSRRTAAATPMCRRCRRWAWISRPSRAL